MTGVIQHRCIGTAQFVGKLTDLVAHSAIVEVGAGNDYKAQFLQRCGHVGSIIGRICQFPGIFIGAVANHQSHTLFSMGNGSRKNQCESCRNQTDDCPQSRPARNAGVQFRSRAHHTNPCDDAPVMV